MKRKHNKGFTLVELLVVIAILAILATVTVVSYTSFTKKAQTSNDITLVKQLNDGLMADEITEGKNKTAHDALEKAKLMGFNIEHLTPTKEGNEIVWGQEENRFILLDGEESNKVLYPDNINPITKENDHKYWKIYKSFPDNKVPSKEQQTFSIVLGNDVYIKTPYQRFYVGYDSNGYHQTYEDGELRTMNFGYYGEEHVIINNLDNPESKITVDNINAEVDFYGICKELNVTNAAQNCVNVYGTIINTLSITNGKVILTTDAKVGDTDAKAKISIGSKYKKSGAPHLELTNSLEIDANIEVANGNLNFLPKSKTSGYVYFITNNYGLTFEATFGSESSLENVFVDNTKLNENIKNESQNVELPDFVSDKDSVTYFDGGSGTEENPYIISKAEHFKNINKLGFGEYAAIKNNLTLTDADLVDGASYFAYQIDGIVSSIDPLNPVTITVDSSRSESVFFKLFGAGAALKNIKFKGLKTPLFDSIYGGTAGNNSLVENVAIESNITNVENNNGALCRYFYFDSSVVDSGYSTFEKVTLNTNFITRGGSARYNGLFIGQVINKAGLNAYLNFNSCIFNGKMVGGKSSIFVGNPLSDTTLNINNFTGDYTIFSSEADKLNKYSSAENDLFNPFASASFANLIAINVDGEPVSLSNGFAKFGQEHFINSDDEGLKISKDASGKAKITKSSLNEKLDYYEIVFYSYVKDTNSDSTVVVEIKERIEKFSEDFVLGTLIDGTFVAEADALAKEYILVNTIMNGKVKVYKDSTEKMYYAVDKLVGKEAYPNYDFLTTLTTTPLAINKAFISAYDADGNLLSSRTTTF